MKTMDVILNRQSVRTYTDQKIDQETLHQILLAAQAGPSCVNAKDWSFIVIDDQEILNKMADANGKPAQPLRQAAVGILVCGDLQRAFRFAKDYWIIDCSIACQNMILAAADHQIGSVWLGTYPQMERVNALKKLFDLPEHIIPHSIIALGYPQKELLKDHDVNDIWEEDRVHYQKW